MFRPARLARLLLTLPLAAIGFVTVASASGTICGTVRDAVTNAPVADAGVFLFATSGDYSGLYAGTDNAGHYCIGAIPAGTYNLEVMVDDHVVATRWNVVVTDQVTGVDMELGAGISFAPPSPNPARSDLRLEFRLPAATAVAIDVLDLQGRRVRSWRSDPAPAGDHAFVWDLRGDGGDPIAPGRYFVLMRAGDVTRVRSFLRLR